MSDLLRPIVGGVLPPAFLLLLAPVWGLSAYPRGRLDILGRGGGWGPEMARPPQAWRRVTRLGGLMLLELVMCGQGTFFFAWSLLVAIVAGGFGVAITEYLLSMTTAGDDFSSSVSWGIAWIIIFFNLFRGLIRFFTVFFRITVNYLVGGILMGMFLGAKLACCSVFSLWSLAYLARLLAVGLPLLGVLLYELGVTYFQLGLFFFLNGEYAAEAWQGANNTGFLWRAPWWGEPGLLGPTLMFLSLLGNKTLMPLAATAEGFSSYLIFFWILGLMGGVALGVLWGLYSLLTCPVYRPHWLERHRLEIVWTVVPVGLIILVGIPTAYQLLWGGGHILEPFAIVTAIGHQWYWEYFHSMGAITSQRDSYTDKSGEWGFRLFSRDAHFLWPRGVPIRLVVSSADVIHNFNIPFLILSIDAVPGRAHRKEISVPFIGLYHGLCSEVCGPGHYSMACTVEVIPASQWVGFWAAEPEERWDWSPLGAFFHPLVCGDLGS